MGPHYINGTLNGELYLDFLQNVLPNLLLEVGENVDQVLYQQDGAPPHFRADVRNHLNQEFPLRWIGRSGRDDLNLIQWCPRSPDLTPLDFFLWGNAKHLVYDNTEDVATVEILRLRITEAMEQIRANMENIPINEQILRRANLCLQANGSTFENLI